MGEAMVREQGLVLGGEWNQLRRADGDLISGLGAIELLARPDLSHGTYPDLEKQRFWEVAVFQMRPGGGSGVRGCGQDVRQRL